VGLTTSEMIGLKSMGGILACLSNEYELSDHSRACKEVNVAIQLSYVYNVVGSYKPTLVVP